MKKESAKARSTSKKITSRSDPYQRYKMAAIPVLLLVLGYVMFGGGKSENKPLVLSTLAGNASKPNAPGPTPNKKQPLIWEEPNLDFISRVNPLISYRTKPELPVLEPVKEVPPVSVAPNSEVVQQNLTQRPVRYVFRSARQSHVMLGEQLLTRGSQLQTGIEVAEIEPDRLMVKVQNQALFYSPEQQVSEEASIPNPFDDLPSPTIVSPQSIDELLREGR
ncbi:MAG: hypothetical protein KDB03_05305 [Planctomycetales bacterium]|nr:hypothetical protein [Planctomycetales bacterium]